MTCEIYYIVLKSSPDLARCREVTGVYVFVLRINTIFFCFLFFSFCWYIFVKKYSQSVFFQDNHCIFFQKYDILFFLKMWWCNLYHLWTRQSKGFDESSCLHFQWYGQQTQGHLGVTRSSASKRSSRSFGVWRP